MSQQPYTNLGEECAVAEEAVQQQQQQQAALTQQQDMKQQAPLQQPMVMQGAPGQMTQTQNIQTSGPWNPGMPTTGVQFLPGQHLPVQNGQQIFVISNPQPKRLNVPTKIVTSLGITQLVVAILGIIFNSVGIAYYCSVNCVGHSIWAGALFLVTASLGIATGKNKGMCLAVSSMVLNIVSCVFAAVVIILAAMGIATEADRLQWKDWGITNLRVALAMDCLMLLCGVTILIISIVLSVVFGKAGCNRQSGTPGNVQYQPAMQTVPMQGFQQAGMISGQQAVGAQPLFHNQQQVAPQPNQYHQMTMQPNQVQQLQTYPIIIPQGTIPQGQQGQGIQPIVYASQPPPYAST